MLNRRILRIKAFKVLYSNAIAENMSLAQAQSQLDVACEATRDLYIYMLGIVSPLTKIARERIESAKTKFNPTEEELNPNVKFAENALAKLLDADVDFQKILSKKKLSWDQYDIFLKKVMNSIASKDYFAEYMASETSSLRRTAVCSPVSSRKSSWTARIWKEYLRTSPFTGMMIWHML